MRYFANPCSTGVVTAMLDGKLGYIDTPRQGNRRPEGVAWCADNGCFSAKWDEGKWWAWLQRNAEHADTCVFAVAPDVVGDALATTRLFRVWGERIRELGYPVAYVAQDGIEKLRGRTSDGGLTFPVPWDSFDVLFLGGSTDWKLGPVAESITREAVGRGVPVHMGRVNSRKRMKIAASWGASSVDGTLLTYGPEKHLAPLVRWVDEINEETQMTATPTPVEVARKALELIDANPDFVYTDGDPEIGCAYTVEDGTTGALVGSCLFGQALVALGVDPARVREHEGKSIDWALHVLGGGDENADPASVSQPVLPLIRAQMAQDEERAWGSDDVRGNVVAFLEAAK